VYCTFGIFTTGTFIAVSTGVVTATCGVPYLSGEDVYIEAFDDMLQVVAARDSIAIHHKKCALLAEAIPTSSIPQYQFKPPQPQQRNHYATHYTH
jgi:hypothetical protein